MLFVDSDVNIIPQKPGLKGALQNAEYAGRTCYNSYDKMTDESYNEFIEMLKRRGHTSPLEFATIYLEAPEDGDVDRFWRSRTEDDDRKKFVRIKHAESVAYITTNYNELLYWNRLNDLQYLVDEPSVYHYVRMMVKWCPIARGIADEFARHRSFSHCIQSTRYCNYTREDKFGSNIRFVLPTKAYRLRDSLVNTFDPLGCDRKYLTNLKGDVLSSNLAAIDRGFNVYRNQIYSIEKSYNELITCGWKPQEARGILGFDVMTEHCMCGFISDWDRFLKIRTAVGAHPDAIDLANKLKKKIEDNG